MTQQKVTTRADAKAAIYEFCSASLQAVGYHDEASLPDDFDLVQRGAVDSLGFMQLILLLEERFGVQIDLDRMPTNKIGVVSFLCDQVVDGLGSQAT